MIIMERKMVHLMCIVTGTLFPLLALQYYIVNSAHPPANPASFSHCHKNKAEDGYRNGELQKVTAVSTSYKAK
jgi:hypothetical protein